MPVFISYRHTDREYAFKIDQRLKVAGIKTYLDVLDEESRQGAEEITDIITKRMSECTHLLAIISDDTSKSWWVPFEIGEATYADNRIATFQLNILDHQLPSYLKKWPKIKNLNQIDLFISSYNKDMKYTPTMESFSGNEADRRIYKSRGYTTTADEFHRVLKQNLGQ
ncbi:toll/interleukin-1 receptor domain-containing protein [Dickeya fangzhongdai]|uniref:Molecular chaperone Tir n=1 Tax=Dickeya fangzhongdai TaxID=1778540 RepID=A0A2K8QGD2_9GAMM|nr:toll/interleukin-1 receptor domain-containing protein [Dickeya fangzhongdai]ATZ92502.1 molecular chaperone Tir [Dickeya fangzhongdai]QOH45931.1 toll/interleukin-1 receptor domain-containing protein [Dickeya fangzhongdai]QOH50239.1 toll/interleukin-1 receptor domain-containing protein [Dickeya fangzhongdai]WOX98526.1 toll/interleukin-1 receptor domain-containing protein [Dickeya fangzhongdai]GGC14031.1 hypothetical protein GCM10007171_34170 [Dickeya fangzhongdai]